MLMSSVFYQISLMSESLQCLDYGKIQIKRHVLLQVCQYETEE